MRKILVMLLLIVSITFAQLGRVETVGYTTYDWQYCGPVYSRCRTDPVANGIHVSWMYSNFTPATDRNMRYNFYDFATRTWNWIDGVNIFTQRSGFGGMDYNPIISGIYVSGQQSIGGTITPVVAGPGGFCQGPPGYNELPIAVTNNQAIHCAMISTSNDSLYYSRIQPWCSWSIPICISSSQRRAGHSNNINSSKTSNKVIITWSQWDGDSSFYRLSLDGGINWGVVTPLPFPPAYSGETIPSYFVTGCFAMFDHNDNFHIVTQVGPRIGNNSFTIPAEIWHYCSTNNPAWSRVFRWEADTLVAPVGYNALFACRPSIVQNPTNNYLYTCWETFDSLNYEPLTNLARADIWIAESPDNGLTWRNQTRITTPNTTSKRFPCVGGVYADTLVVAYMIDSIAGFENYVQGRATRNPIAVHRIPLPLSGIEEQLRNNTVYPKFDVRPNPFSVLTKIHYSLSANNNISLEIYDVSGKLVKSLVSGLKPKGEYMVMWDGRNDIGEEVKSSVYFYTLKTSNNTLTGKIVKAK